MVSDGWQTRAGTNGFKTCWPAGMEDPQDPGGLILSESVRRESSGRLRFRCCISAESGVKKV